MRLYQAAGLALLGVLPTVFGGNVLSTEGFTTCQSDPDITVNNVDISFDKSTNIVTFNVAGSSAKQQEVVASLVVTAYGKQVYSNTFDPCAANTKIDQLCPVPAGSFAAVGSQEIPSKFASVVPAIAFTVPNLDGVATLNLQAKDGGQNLACISSSVGNGKTAAVPAVSYVSAGIGGAALVLTSASALGSVGHAGASTMSPTFGEVFGWFSGMAMNGMLSVGYPAVYRDFTKNFGFSTGLIQWNGMQKSIDSFRKHTGGNLTGPDNNVLDLQNATLVYSNGGSPTNTTTKISKRTWDILFDTADLTIRDFSTTVNGTQSGSSNSTGSGSNNKVSHLVHGIQGYVEELTIPEANTFMTVLLIFAILVAVIVVGILLFKVILEGWAMFASFPQKLTSFRKNYWWITAKTITNLILLLYGIWTLYCIFQVSDTTLRNHCLEILTYL